MDVDSLGLYDRSNVQRCYSGGKTDQNQTSEIDLGLF